MAATWPHPSGVARAENINELYLAINDRIEMLGLTWAGLDGVGGDPGQVSGGVWNYWQWLRRAIEALATHFCGASDWLNYPAWATLADAAFGTGVGNEEATDWRNYQGADEYSRVGHLLLDIKDAKASLDLMSHVYKPMSGSWTNWSTPAGYPAYGIYLGGTSPSNYTAAWADRVNCTPAPYSIGKARIVQSKPFDDYLANFGAFIAQYGVDDMGSPSDVKMRVHIKRVITGSGGSFAVHVEGAASEPATDTGDIGAMSIIGTSASAGAGASTQTITLSDYYRFVRISHPDWQSGSPPFGESAGVEEARVSGNVELRLEYAFSPF